MTNWSNLERPLPPILDYVGEFGPELVLCLPFFNWLSKIGILRYHRISTYRGMKCFYDDLDCLEIVEKTQHRLHIPAKERPSWLPIRNEHSFDGKGRCPQHLYPDLRQKFRKLPLLPDIGSAQRPILVIHNKHNDEWNSGPINFIPIETLRTAFRSLSRDFTIVYVRHGILGPTRGFTDDHNTALPFKDRELLDDCPNVWCFDDLYAAHCAQGGQQDVNTFKNVLYSRCHHFISSQGGGAHQIALYSGSFLAILHRKGLEQYWAYSGGYYNFMAAVPPIMAICRNEGDLLRALPLFTGTVVIDDRVYLNTGNDNEQRLRELSALTIAERCVDTSGE